MNKTKVLIFPSRVLQCRERIMFHPRKKRLPYKRKLQNGDMGKNPMSGTKMPPKMKETTSFRGIPSFPGDRASCPREGTFPRPPLAELDGGARSFAGGTYGCCVRRAWRGAATRPRGVRWRSGEPVIRGAN